ncbi:MAG: hypothetical protein HKP61_21365 [Dactylosporangium sp.]|nr:hypothetical protein [Dactylosporangium sp.]NNJ63432.1 hypothetical protein [Dactylosporangium sp.]
MTRRTVDDSVRLARLQGQRMETLGLLAAGIAHDMNNLLTVIANYAAFASGSDADVPPDADHWRRLLADIGHIQRAAARGTELTGRLLAYARPTAAATAAASPLTVGTVVTETLTLLRGAIGGQIVLRTLLEPDCRPVRIGSGELGQVLVNLIVNARDAMPEGGTLGVWAGNVTRADRTERERRGTDRTSEWVRLDVRDSGTGIPPEVRSRILDPFFTTKPAGRGSGLGLAIVHEIVTEAGGEVLIDSEPGLGTTVSLLLPAWS